MSEPREHELEQEKVVEMMRSDRFCMLTSVGDDGRLQSHPMTPQEVTDEGERPLDLGVARRAGGRAQVHVGAVLHALGVRDAEEEDDLPVRADE